MHKSDRRRGGFEGGAPPAAPACPLAHTDTRSGLTETDRALIRRAADRRIGGLFLDAWRGGHAAGADTVTELLLLVFAQEGAEAESLDRLFTSSPFYRTNAQARALWALPRYREELVARAQAGAAGGLS